MDRYPKTHSWESVNSHGMTEKQVEWFRKWFPVTVNKELAAAMGVNYYTVTYYGHALKLKKDPDALKRIKKENGKKFRATVKKERRRKSLGLSQRTHIHLPERPYTPQQANIRARFRQPGYIVPAARGVEAERYVIYYDKNTDRNIAREKNATRYGFRILSIENRWRYNPDTNFHFITH